MSENKRQIYSNTNSLIRAVEIQSPLLTNLGARFSFTSKLQSLEIMQRKTIETAEKLLESSIREKNEDVIFLKDTTKYHIESAAFFEAYLNAFYSLFQIIAKVTPYFYDQKAIKKKIPDVYFERQKNFFMTHREIGKNYTKYLEEQMIWYDDIVCNRHAISHNVSAFLGFGKEQIEFIHMPKKKIHFFENGKPMKKLLEYIETNWESLFSFLDFYSKHFSNSLIFSDKLEELEKIRELVSKNFPT